MPQHRPTSDLGTPLSPLVSDVFKSASSFVRRASGTEKLRLPALGYIGEEIEGQLPEAYYDVHASQFLMSVLVVTRMLPTVATYFCDTFPLVHMLLVAFYDFPSVEW
jgi:hypothetical protein